MSVSEAPAAYSGGGPDYYGGERLHFAPRTVLLADVDGTLVGWNGQRLSPTGERMLHPHNVLYIWTRRGKHWADEMVARWGFPARDTFTKPSNAGITMRQILQVTGIQPTAVIDDQPEMFAPDVHVIAVQSYGPPVTPAEFLRSQNG